MKEYVSNCALSALVSFLMAVLTYLIGNECGSPSVATAMAAGGIVGVVNAISYNLGQFFAGKSWNKQMFIRIIVMLVTGVAFGIFGGWTMGL